MVMQYMCLFYGGDSSQYRNYCLYREVVNSEGENDRKLIAKSPCRSYCVQVTRLFLLFYCPSMRSLLLTLIYRRWPRCVRTIQLSSRLATAYPALHQPIPRAHRVRSLYILDNVSHCVNLCISVCIDLLRSFDGL